MHFKLPPIYPITDAAVSGLTPVEQVRRLADGGAALIQLREKEATSRKFFEEAGLAVEAGHERGARILVNDRVDIALLTGADGVHLGQSDLSPVDARRLLGDDAIIGYSTHDIDQVRNAITLPIDYLAFGPVFATRTKRDADPVVGLARLAEVKEFVGRLPLVAIGGIRPEDLEAVFRAGADSAAMISGILYPPENITGSLANLLRSRLL